MSETGMDTIRRILKAEINDNARTRLYQEHMDSSVDVRVASFREDDTPLYVSGRRGQTPGALAFCCYSPLSRYHGSNELLEYFSKSLDHWADEQLAGTHSGMDTWGYTWDFEGFAYGYVWLEDALDAAVKDKMLAALSASSSTFLNRRGGGQIGNQAAIGAQGDLLLGYLLDRPDCLAKSRERFEKDASNTLWHTGQVVEQYGPCHHYSYTAFSHAFLYTFLADTHDYDDRILAALDWFRRSQTESMYQITGASSRKFVLHHDWSPLYPGMEYAAAWQPMYWKLMDRTHAADSSGAGSGYSCGAPIWQILINKGDAIEPTEEQLADWNKSSTRFYESVHYGRGPIKYGLIRRKYQTGIAFTGWLPTMGLQTWAWGDEPPIIQMVHDVPSCTIAWGVDSARFPASHLYYKNGPGCMAADVVWREEGSSRENLPDEPAFVVWRNHTLRSVAIFTDVSTVLIQTGPTGRRVTRWTLNSIEPATVLIDADDGVVRFENRTPTIQALRGAPVLAEEHDADSDTMVQTLSYEIVSGPAAFAFSNGTFRFTRDDLDESGILEFSDETGVYSADISTIADEHGDLNYGLGTAKIKRIAGQ